jgi:NAD dependent epimerase/dehydratase family enzyme
MEAKVMLSVYEIIGIIAAIAVPLAGAVIFERKRNEAKNKTIVELTRSFVDSTKEVAKAIENNTRVIEKLPEQFVLHMKANGR